MNKLNILPADTYIVVSKTILNDIDRKILTMLYQPIIGYTAINLYFSLWSDLDTRELMSIEFTHHHLMCNMKLKLSSIIEARQQLEAIGLMKSYVKSKEVNNYIYELYSPISAFDFFNHPILNVVLYSNLGKKEYERLLSYFEIPKFNLKGFEDITVSFSDVYDTIPSDLNAQFKENIVRSNSLDININSKIDFDLLIESIPNNLLTNRTFNKEIKDLINKLSYIYNIDSLNMQGIIRNALTERGAFDKELLRKSCRNYYQFEEVGSLPTLIYRSQPDYLKTPTGDTSKRAKMIYTFEKVTPYDFLKSKYNGSEPTARDLRILESLMIDQELKPGVVNVLIDYVLKTNNNKLTKAFIETIAGQWKRLNIETVEEAMNIAEKEHKKYKKKITSPKKIVNREEKVPTWFDKRIEEEELTTEEQEEIDAMLKEFS
ncbi:MAG: DnaD domain protein [Bacilli bacterium]|nr:DnaD domain protein [Bacilli bacterium]